MAVVCRMASMSSDVISARPMAEAMTRRMVWLWTVGCGGIDVFRRFLLCLRGGMAFPEE